VEPDVAAAISGELGSQRRQLKLIASENYASPAVLRQALAGTGFEQPRRAILDVLRRAASRGEVPPHADIELVPDIVLGLNLLKMVRGELPDRAHQERVLHNIIHPLLSADHRD
jgi:hypothetical protein